MLAQKSRRSHCRQFRSSGHCALVPGLLVADSVDVRPECAQRRFHPSAPNWRLLGSSGRHLSAQHVSTGVEYVPTRQVCYDRWSRSNGYLCTTLIPVVFKEFLGFFLKL